MSLGGVIGGSLVNFLGYFGVFLAFTILTLLTAPLIFIFKEPNPNPGVRRSPSSLTVCQFLRVRRSLLGLLNKEICDLLLYSLEPTLAVRLKTDFSFSSSQIGLYFFFFFGGGALTMTCLLWLPE